jgi:hypothetical protein
VDSKLFFVLLVQEVRSGHWTTVDVTGIEDGAVGENRTHDLSLTKGLRYHYATTATVVSVPTYMGRTLNPELQAGGSPAG